MGTAQAQGLLWGAKAATWAAVQEPAWRPVYEFVLARAGVATGTRLLDVGCGAGGALVVARGLGAEVAGLDASASLAAIARTRLPDARVEVGEMEELPFADASFDFVTGFNAFQFAGDPVRALREARRVCVPGGAVAMLVWGRKEESDLLSATMPTVFALLPLPPNVTPPVAFAETGVIEGMMGEAGLSVSASGELDCAFVYPNVATAWLAISSAGPCVRAVAHAGESAVKKAVLATLAPFTQRDGVVMHNNRFRWVLATRQ